MLERVAYVVGEDEPYPGPGPDSSFLDKVEAIAEIWRAAGKSLDATVEAYHVYITKHARPPVRDPGISAPVAYLSPTSGHWEHFHMDPAFGGVAPLISWTDEYIKPLSDKVDTSIIDPDRHGRSRQPHGPYEGKGYSHRHQKRY